MNNAIIIQQCLSIGGYTEKWSGIFYDMLRLYAGQCRRWEEHHNGSCCVVERVRDTYIMPKVREFADRLQVKPVEAPQPAPTVEALISGLPPARSDTDVLAEQAAAIDAREAQP
jgi:hypothetical protein